MTQPSPTLLLLHGLGATAGVWSEVMTELDWPGRIVVPDLAGHGSAPWTDDYSLATLATGAAAELAEGERTFVIGHSLGGAVGLELASGRYRPEVVALIGLGIKTTWTDDDVAGMAKVAERGIRWFESKDEAIARFLRMSGLDGLVEADHPAVSNAVVAGESVDADGDSGPGWRLAQDPATFAQQPVVMDQLLAAVSCPVVLGAGATDAMATKAELATFCEHPRIAEGCGHNVQVERPGWVGDLLAEVMLLPEVAGH